MPFFLRPQAPAHPAEDIFALLSALDSSTSPCAPRKHQKQEQTFTPRFDILETPAAYELYGEVPGLDKESLSIEFEDAQTLVVKGKSVRPAASSAAVEQKGKEVEQVNEKEKRESHQPTVETVEDEYDAVDTPLTTPSSSSSSTSTATATAEEKKPESTQPKPKYWVSERRVGSFARSFSFSQRLDIDGVKAELRDGVLHLVVPKSVKPNKVAISVA